MQTGGKFFAFSGAEILPDIQTYLEPLRFEYSLSYTSTIDKPGSHSLVIKIKRGDLQLSTPLQVFSLNILPPNPMFLSPPVEITRNSPADSLNPQDDLAPREQTLQILVEFPDGYKRPLKFLRLYVDNQMVVEKTGAPFDSLVWDLTGYTTPGRHLLRLEVQDVLGLTRTSSDTIHSDWHQPAAKTNPARPVPFQHPTGCHCSRSGGERSDPGAGDWRAAPRPDS